MTRAQFDDLFPTLIRYTGWAAMIALIVAAIFGNTDYPGAFVAAGGMILYKTVKKGVEGDGDG